MLTRLTRYLNALGLAPDQFRAGALSLPSYLRQYRMFRRASRPEWRVSANFPMLHDRRSAGGVASGHYFHQDLAVARRIYERRPPVHGDIGSRVDGFVAHVSIFCPIHYYDVRAVNASIPNIKFFSGNLQQPESLPESAYLSLSCLHVIEHVGLGRYGDAVDPEGWRVAMRALGRALKPAGILYLSTPIGIQRVEFNAHRVFDPATIVAEALSLRLEPRAFSWINDAGGYCQGEGASIPEETRRFSYGCGIFEFQKPA